MKKLSLIVDVAGAVSFGYFVFALFPAWMRLGVHNAFWLWNTGW